MVSNDLQMYMVAVPTFVGSVLLVAKSVTMRGVVVLGGAL